MDGLKKAHIRDGAAVVQYLAWLDKQVFTCSHYTYIFYLLSYLWAEMRSLPDLVLDLSQDAVSPDLLILFLFTFAHSSFMGLREETLVIVALYFGFLWGFPT